MWNNATTCGKTRVKVSVHVSNRHLTNRIVLSRSKQNRNSPKEKKITKHNITKEMAQQQNSPRDQRDSRPQGDVFSVSGDDDEARKQGAGSSNPGPKIVTMGSVDTVTIGEALEVTALSLGDKPVDRKDAAAIQAAETRATGDSKTRPGGLAEAAQEAAATNERTALEEAKVTIADILTVRNNLFYYIFFLLCYVQYIFFIKHTI